MRGGPSLGGDPGTNNSGPADLSQISFRSMRAGESVEVFQINCHKSINSNLTLAFHSQNFSQFCYAVQEPYCTKTGHFLHVSGGNRNIISTNPLELPRAIIVHSKQLPIIPLQQYCTRDLAAGLVTYKQKGMAAWQTKTLLIISAYWDINLPEIPKEVHDVVNYAKSRNLTYQIHMDSNCHSTLFGSRDQNERGNLRRFYGPSWHDSR